MQKSQQALQLVLLIILGTLILFATTAGQAANLLPAAVQQEISATSESTLPTPTKTPIPPEQIGSTDGVVFLSFVIIAIVIIPVVIRLLYEARKTGRPVSKKSR